MIKNSKQRAYLKSLAMELQPIVQIGKSGLTPELTTAVKEAIEARELIKIRILKTAPEDTKELAFDLAMNTRSEIVQIIGRTLILYRRSREHKIVLP